MPNIVDIQRSYQDGTKITQSDMVVGTTATTYTYPTPQDNFELWNKGFVNLTLTVGTYSNQTVTPGQKWKNDTPFTTFTISAASGHCEFLATAIDYATANALVIKGTTAQRPTASAVIGQEYFDTTIGKPIWKKTVTTWCDATGTTV